MFAELGQRYKHHTWVCIHFTAVPDIRQIYGDQPKESL
jgi:hypothetical protein